MSPKNFQSLWLPATSARLVCTSFARDPSPSELRSRSISFSSASPWVTAAFFSPPERTCNAAKSRPCPVGTESPPPSMTCNSTATIASPPVSSSPEIFLRQVFHPQVFRYLRAKLSTAQTLADWNTLDLNSLPSVFLVRSSSHRKLLRLRSRGKVSGGKMKKLGWVLVVFVSLCFSPTLYGQATGSFSGIVLDPSGSVISGPKVTAPPQGSRAPRSATTAAPGHSLTPSLPLQIHTLLTQSHSPP